MKIIFLLRLRRIDYFWPLFLPICVLKWKIVVIKYLAKHVTFKRNVISKITSFLMCVSFHKLKIPFKIFIFFFLFWIICIFQSFNIAIFLVTKYLFSSIIFTDSFKTYSEYRYPESFQLFLHYVISSHMNCVE